VRRAARLLLYAGTVAAVLGLGKYHAAEIGHYDLTNSSRFAWSFAYAGLLGLAAYGVGLPDLARTRRIAAVLAVMSTVAAAAGISLVQLVVGDALLPRFVVFSAALVLVPWYMLCAALAGDTRARQEERDRVVAVVSLDEEEALRTELAQGPERAASIVAALRPDQARTERPDSRPLADAAAAGRATVVVLDRVAQGDESIVAQAALLHERGVRVRSLTFFYDEWLGKLPMSELERLSLMFDIGEIHRARYGRLKRLLDVVVAGMGVIPFVVALPFVVLGDFVGNRGPLFYQQPRVGKNGRVFSILKFRTMRPGSSAGEWTAADDPRVSRFGHWLRRSHVDELPQVVNILRGDLSVVGPRPEQPQYVEELVEKIPFYDLRHVVRPGLTGWAQVKYGYAGSEADALEKLQHEFYYLRHQSLALDARIITRTLRSVVRRGGR